MGFKSWIRTGIGLAGKHAMNFLNGATGGLAGMIANKVTNDLDNNSGLIGKVVGHLGRKYLSQKTRDRLSRFADKALEYLPDSKVKTALSNINDAAQNKTPPVRALAYDGNTTGVHTETKKIKPRGREPPPGTAEPIPLPRRSKPRTRAEVERSKPRVEDRYY